MTPITNQITKDSLSLWVKKQDKAEVIKHLTSIGTTMNNAFNKALQEQKKHHTIDYADKKENQYKRKYNIDIQPYPYRFEKNKDIMPLVEKYLNCKNHKPVGFYAYHSFFKNHVDAFIVYDQKILVFQSSLSSDDIVYVLKNNFPCNKIYVQRKIEQEKSDWDVDDETHYNHPQKDGISCPVFALKYLKECLKDDAKMLHLTQFIDDTQEFMIHPAVERYSQSDEYYMQAKKNWQQNYQSDESDALLAKADAWRQQYDKTRTIYYLFKDLNKDNGYEELETVKQNIIEACDTNKNDF